MEPGATSQFNDAYRTLRDPVRRTEYLLKLEGIEIEEQSKAATEKARASGQLKKQTVPPELLEEVFELNELLEEARANRERGEHDTDLEQRAAADEGVAGRAHGGADDGVAQSMGRVGCAGGRGLIGATDREKVLGKMLDVLNRRSYIRNLMREMEEI